jgi:hypothetical protein
MLPFDLGGGCCVVRVEQGFKGVLASVAVGVMLEGGGGGGGGCMHDAASAGAAAAGLQKGGGGGGGERLGGGEGGVGFSPGTLGASHKTKV